MTLKELPKIELHVHLDGSVRIDTVNELLKINNANEKMVAPEKCIDLNDYLTKFELPIQVMQTKANIERISSELVEDLEKENIIYAEIRFAPIKHIEKGLTLNEVVDAVLEGINRGNVKTNLILCMMRDSSYEENLKMIQLAKKYLNKGVVALDLAGAEGIYKTKCFKKLFEIAKNNNIPYTIHAGEADGPDSINAAIDFSTSRIGHGIRILEDKKLIKEVNEKNILLEICPTSNVQTNVVDKYSNHPIKKIIENNIEISINTDNRTVSNVTLTQEYQKLIDNFNFTYNDLILINKNSIKHSFLNNNEKKELNKIFDNLNI